VDSSESAGIVVTFAGSGDAFGSRGRLQACIHIRRPGPDAPVLVDCGATSLAALMRCGDPGQIEAVVVSHLHGDHFGGLPFLILDGQFSRRTAPLTVIGPPGTRSRLDTAMECMFPGSAAVQRRFHVHVVELEPGFSASAAGVQAAAREAAHPSGAPALALRLVMNGKIIACTGDTEWTDALTEVRLARTCSSRRRIAGTRLCLTTCGWLIREPPGRAGQPPDRADSHVRGLLAEAGLFRFAPPTT
jgi:ribonuclease BN (tRNA processing enzyme)